MRMISKAVVVGVVCIGIAGSSFAGTYGGGTGTEEDPYQILTAEQMNEIGKHEGDWDKHFILVNDIDLSQYTGRSFRCIGSVGYMVIEKPFSGVFDGNGKVISGFRYENSDDFVVGLFRGVGNGGVVRNLGIANPFVNIKVSQGYVLYEASCLVAILTESGLLENCWLEGGRVEGSESVGLLAGVCIGTIRQCRVTGTVLGSKSVGGIVGLNWGIIEKCSFRGTVGGIDAVGGLCGLNKGTISNSYGLCNVSGTNEIGGLVGQNGGKTYSFPNPNDDIAGTIHNSFASGLVSGETATGGVVGHDHVEIGEFTNCFWDSSRNPTLEGIGNYSNSNVSGKTTTQLHQQSTFTDWDFINIWNIGENQTYPYIRTHSAADINKDRTVNVIDLSILAGQWMKEE